MNLENGAGSGGTGAGTTPPPAAGAPPPAGAPGEWRNPEEIKAYFKRTQALEAELVELRKLVPAGATGGTAAATPPPAAGAGGPVDAAAITAQVMSEVTFSTTMSLTPNLSADQQAMLRTLFTVEKPAPDKVGDWMKTKLAALGRAPAASAGTAQQTTTPPAQSQARTDLGAPATGVGEALPDDPRAIPIDQWKSMDPTKRHEITKRWMSRNGGNTGILSRKRA